MEGNTRRETGVSSTPASLRRLRLCRCSTPPPTMAPSVAGVADFRSSRSARVPLAHVSARLDAARWAPAGRPVARDACGTAAESAALVDKQHSQQGLLFVVHSGGAQRLGRVARLDGNPALWAGRPSAHAGVSRHRGGALGPAVRCRAWASGAGAGRTGVRLAIPSKRALERSGPAWPSVIGRRSVPGWWGWPACRGLCWPRADGSLTCRVSETSAKCQRVLLCFGAGGRDDRRPHPQPHLRRLPSPYGDRGELPGAPVRGHGDRRAPAPLLPAPARRNGRSSELFSRRSPGAPTARPAGPTRASARRQRNVSGSWSPFGNP